MSAKFVCDWRREFSFDFRISISLSVIGLLVEMYTRVNRISKFGLKEMQLNLNSDSRRMMKLKLIECYQQFDHI